MIILQVILTDYEKDKLMKEKFAEKDWRDKSNDDFATYKISSWLKTVPSWDDFHAAIMKGTVSALAPIWYENFIMNAALGHFIEGEKWLDCLNEDIAKNEKQILKDRRNPLIPKWMKEECSISAFPKQRGKPCLVVAAGPDIWKHNQFKMLRERGWKGPVITTDRMLRPLLEAGISPKNGFDVYVASVDGHRIHIPKMYQNKDGSSLDAIGVKGMFCSTVAPQAYISAMEAGIDVKWFHGIQDDMFQMDSVTGALNWMFEAPGISAGGNVGSTSWTLGVYLWCNPIVYIGLDLGYPEETPIEETAYYESFKMQGGQVGDMLPLFTHGVNPDFNTPYKQDPVFKNYRDNLFHILETWIRENKVRAGQPGVYPVDTYNATGGGSFHHPTLVKGIQFSEALDRWGKNK